MFIDEANAAKRALACLNTKFVIARLVEVSKLAYAKHGAALVAHVLTLLERNVRACINAGVGVENLDQVIIASVEDFELSLQHGPKESVLHKEEYPEGYGSSMRYDQYIAPRDL